MAAPSSKTRLTAREKIRIVQWITKNIGDTQDTFDKAKITRLKLTNILTQEFKDIALITKWHVTNIVKSMGLQFAKPQTSKSSSKVAKIYAMIDGVGNRTSSLESRVTIIESALISIRDAIEELRQKQQ